MISRRCEGPERGVGCPRVRFRIAAAALACALIWPAVTAWRALTRGYVVTDDLNGDHRPDRWREYDAAGRLVRIARDTNFDGAADVEEYYREGVVVRREIDRNFDGRVDQIDELDPETGERLVSVQDDNFDGAADRLVVSRDGHAVFEETATRAAGNEPHADSAASHADELAPLQNPFLRDRTLRAMLRGDHHRRAVGGWKLLVGVRAREGLEVPGAVAPGADDQCHTTRLPASPSRGPPPLHLA